MLISLGSNITRLAASDLRATGVGCDTAASSLPIDSKCRFALALLSANFNPAAPELTPGLHGALNIAVATINQVRESLEDESVVFNGSLSNQLVEEVGAIIICFPRLIHGSVIAAVAEYNRSFGRPALVLDPAAAALQKIFLKIPMRTGLALEDRKSVSTGDRHAPESACTPEEEIADTTSQQPALMLGSASLHEKAVKAFHGAIAMNEREMVEQLLRTGMIDINISDAKGLNGIFIALIQEYFELADWLLERGADPTQQFISGGTVLHAAAIGNQKSVIEWLINHGIDINTPTNNRTRMTPLDLAEMTGDRELALWLLSQGARRSF